MKKKIDIDLPELHGHKKSPLLKVIRRKCLDCCCNQHSEVRLCKDTTCSLWPYRMGKNPFHTRTMTKEQKEKATKNLPNQ